MLEKFVGFFLYYFASVCSINPLNFLCSAIGGGARGERWWIMSWTLLLFCKKKLPTSTTNTVFLLLCILPAFFLSTERILNYWCNDKKPLSTKPTMCWVLICMVHVWRSHAHPEFCVQIIFHCQCCLEPLTVFFSQCWLDGCGADFSAHACMLRSNSVNYWLWKIRFYGSNNIFSLRYILKPWNSSFLSAAAAAEAHTREWRESGKKSFQVTEFHLKGSEWCEKIVC